MAIKKTTQVGNPIIRKRCKAVKISDIGSIAVKKTVRDLTDSMREHSLVGMAANQIGVDTRIFVAEVRKTGHRQKVAEKDLVPLLVFINPKIIKHSKKEVKGYEGCGSVLNGGLWGHVPRPEKVTVTAHNELGEKFVLETGGLLARIIQHEIDHLDGKIFLDRCDSLSVMEKSEFKKMIKKKT